VNVVAALDGAAPLLYAHVVVAKIERVKLRPFLRGKLETHLRVAHEVAVLLSVVGYGNCGKSAGA